MEGKLLYKIHIRGYVQGVGFRWSAAREAKILGITGLIRNMTDGSVYIEAEGSCTGLCGISGNRIFPSGQLPGIQD
jgi:acylphosphatase